MIGIGCVTYERPWYFRQSIESIIDKLFDFVDVIVIYNDGSKNVEYKDVYKSIRGPKVKIVEAYQNRGVGYAKNRLFKDLLLRGCDYIFIAEDDIIIDSPKAVTSYIDLYKETGIEHFNYAHHGGLNDDPEKIKIPSKVDGNVETFTNCVGAWSFYTRNCLEKVGLIDENFHNAWDHVEHTKRIAVAGLTTPFWEFADHKDSRIFIHEIPDVTPVIDKSNPKWEKNKNDGLKYWMGKDGEGLPPYGDPTFV